MARRPPIDFDRADTSPRPKVAAVFALSPRLASQLANSVVSSSFSAKVRAGLGASTGASSTVSTGCFAAGLSAIGLALGAVLPFRCVVGVSLPKPQRLATLRAAGLMSMPSIAMTKSRTLPLASHEKQW